MPVIDLVNGINSPDLSAKSLVSFYTMGQSTGEYLAKKHPAGSPPSRSAGSPARPVRLGGGRAPGLHGRDQGQRGQVLDPKYGDTGKEAQSKLVEDVLQANPDIDLRGGHRRHRRSRHRHPAARAA